MSKFDQLKQRLDSFQQGRAATAFPVAVIKRYGDDQTGKQAALITYFAFLSMFPLILAFITILGIVASGDPALQQRISIQLFMYFPALGDDISRQLHSIKGSGLVLAIELLIVLYGARGLAVILQDAFKHVWQVGDDKTNLVKQNLRSFGMMFAVGGGIIISTVVGYVLGSIIHLGIAGTLFITAVNAALTCALFIAVFRLGTPSRIKTKDLLLGAIISGLGLLVIQRFGTFIMGRELPKLTGTYGSFAIALALLFWLYLQAQIIMYAATITAVRASHDWPKKLF